jgi:hypothetical protein
MKETYLVCDQCKNKTQTEPPRFGNRIYNWIIVSKTTSDSGETLMAGQHTFCSDKCLAKYMKKELKGS